MAADTPLRVCIAGASGRMGHMLIEAVLATDDCVLTAALDQPGHPSIGQDATAFLGRTGGVQVQSDLAAGLRGCDVLIDFTRPDECGHFGICASGDDEDGLSIGAGV